MRPARLTDDEILRRARRVFVEWGYAARTRQIAAAVGMTWGAIVLRFRDKRDLFTQAMAAPQADACDAEWRQAGDVDLHDLLTRVRSHLSRQWPLRLQVRLAMPVDDPDAETARLVDRLAGALEAHARRGAVRSDVGPRELAQIVVTLLVGDVARRFVARETIAADDGAFVERVTSLLSGA